MLVRPGLYLLLGLLLSHPCSLFALFVLTAHHIKYIASQADIIASWTHRSVTDAHRMLVKKCASEASEHCLRVCVLVLDAMNGRDELGSHLLLSLSPFSSTASSLHFSGSVQLDASAVMMYKLEHLELSGLPVFSPRALESKTGV